jgi:hypothetical protein
MSSEIFRLADKQVDEYLDLIKQDIIKKYINKKLKIVKKTNLKIVTHTYIDINFNTSKDTRSFIDSLRKLLDYIDYTDSIIRQALQISNSKQNFQEVQSTINNQKELSYKYEPSYTTVEDHTQLPKDLETILPDNLRARRYSRINLIPSFSGIKSTIPFIQKKNPVDKPTDDEDGFA